MNRVFCMAIAVRVLSQPVSMDLPIAVQGRLTSRLKQL